MLRFSAISTMPLLFLAAVSCVHDQSERPPQFTADLIAWSSIEPPHEPEAWAQSRGQRTPEPVPETQPPGIRHRPLARARTRVRISLLHHSGFHRHYRETGLQFLVEDIPNNFLTGSTAGNRRNRLKDSVCELWGPWTRNKISST